MINYSSEIETLFDLFEQEKLPEQEIFYKCIDLVKNHNFNRDYQYDLNDTLLNRGYSFQFDVPKLNKELFDADKYNELIKKAKKSVDSTKALIDYLKMVKDYRLSFASLYLLKTKYLIMLNILPSNNKYVLEHQNDNFNKTLFLSFIEDEDAKNILIESLTGIGVNYSSLEYMRFRLDIEFLLWSLEKDNPKYGYIKVNTIKIALNMAKKEYFVHEGKLYYNIHFSKLLKDYVAAIDYDLVSKIVSKWNYIGNELDNTGAVIQ